MNDTKVDNIQLFTYSWTKFISWGFHGISILSQKEGEKNAVAAMVNGNPVEIIIGIIKAMNSDRQVKAILEAAVEHQDLLNSSHVSAVDKLAMNFDKN